MSEDVAPGIDPRRTRRCREADTPGRALLGRQNPVEAVVGERLRAYRVRRMRAHFAGE